MLFPIGTHAALAGVLITVRIIFFMYTLCSENSIAKSPVFHYLVNFYMLMPYKYSNAEIANCK